MSLRKLKNASFQELRARASQRVAAFKERQGWSSLVNLPSDEALSILLVQHVSGPLLDHFRSRSDPNLFHVSLPTAHLTSELLSRWPQLSPQTVDEANRICEGKFDLLGLQEVSFGNPIDWHLEPTSGKQIPPLHWSKLDFLDAEIAGDKKVTWELNRHQYFSKLGQAYRFTGDEKYAREFVSHLEAWMDANPPKLGINWASSLEVAFRSISWLWAFYFFKDSQSLSPETFQRALKFMYLNGRHLESYLSTYFSPNTHLTGEALGLFYLGLLLPEFKDAERWRHLGTKILLEQIPIHVKKDGVYFEQSSYYHRYTTDFYLHFLILSRANRIELPPEVEQALVLLLEHLMYITRPDGSTPFFGDDDGGRLVKLDVRPANDFRSTLATGAVLFNRADFKFVAGDAYEEVFWLLGQEGVKQYESMVAHEPAGKSKPFYEGGYFVMRDGWTTDSNYLLFDCGPHGMLNCGHAHADALAIDVAASGRTLLVDPGTFTYTGSEEMRNWFRSSQAHNTITVDNQSSSVPSGPFTWHTTARCNLNSWISTEQFDYVSGEHHGYERLSDPVLHTRSILFLKRGYWVIRDRLTCQDAHQASLRFQLDSNCNAEIRPSSDHPHLVETSGFEIHSFSTGKASPNMESAWVSKCYGEKEPAPAYVFSTQFQGDYEVITFLVPRGSNQPKEIREIKAEGGRVFVLSDTSCTDIVMIRTGERAECADLTTNFEWLWARFSKSDQRIDRFLAVNGTIVTHNGENILNTGSHATFVDAHQTGDGFVIESDTGHMRTLESSSVFDQAYMWLW